MTFLDWGALVVGGGLMMSGVRAIRRSEAYVPERYERASAVRLGWLRLAFLPLLIPFASVGGRRWRDGDGGG